MWSSTRCAPAPLAFRLGAPNPLVTPHPMFEAMGREAFVELCSIPLPDETVNRIRERTQKGWALGAEAFLDRVEAALGSGSDQHYLFDDPAS
jgi:hypothetical protein